MSTKQTDSYLTILKTELKPQGNRRRTYAYCKCKCGNEKWIVLSLVQKGRTRSCGCLALESVTTHGHKRMTSVSSEYVSWYNMKTRCFNKNSDRYPYYGGRGISVCERWKNSFEAFLLDMGVKPTSKHTLERMNFNGNYEPSNCTWATRKQQANNRRPGHARNK